MYISRAVGIWKGFGSSGHTRILERSRWDTLRIRSGKFRQQGAAGGSSWQQWAPGSRCIRSGFE